MLTLQHAPPLTVSIHAPREGCDVLFGVNESGELLVSIHAPREGCDQRVAPSAHLWGGFNSRTPGGVRHHHFMNYIARSGFNSRTPGGVRRLHFPRSQMARLFQFTHPGRGATWSASIYCYRSIVSIHAPREGCDVALFLTLDVLSLFQFTHPGRGATIKSSPRY